MNYNFCGKKITCATNRYWSWQ